jgi:hypothetical protein
MPTALVCSDKLIIRGVADWNLLRFKTINVVIMCVTVNLLSWSSCVVDGDQPQISYTVVPHCYTAQPIPISRSIDTRTTRTAQAKKRVQSVEWNHLMRDVEVLNALLARGNANGVISPDRLLHRARRHELLRQIPPVLQGQAGTIPSKRTDCMVLASPMKMMGRKVHGSVVA